MTNLLTFNPPSYGLFHFGWIITTIIAAILFCYFWGRKHNENTDKKVVFTIGCILLASEIFKQIYYTIANGSYAWHQFPLQFCSIPMYVAFVCFFIKNAKIKEICYTFLAFFGLLAGVSVIAEPSGVFWYPYTAMVLHSCLWHSLMIILGIYLIYSRNYGKKLIELVKGSTILIISIIIAIAFNEIMYYALFKNMSESLVCNAFYISSHFHCSLPILSSIQQAVPYVIFVLIYFLAFCLGVLLIWSIVFLIRFITSKAHKPQKMANDKQQ